MMYNPSINLQYLKPGDVVDIVAPSSKCHISVLEKMKALLESWGLQAYAPPDLFGESLLYANSDEKRFQHVEYALTNSRSKAIWCLLGGFGSIKIIPYLAKMNPPPHPKLFIGLSDITALHIFLQTQWGWPTIHGPSGYQISLNKISDDSITAIKRLIFKKEPALVYEDLIPLNHVASEEAIINAEIIGGNLHMIQTTLGTPWQINTADKIIFIEEINERAYRIDRVLAHMAQTGVLEKARAILVGDIIDSGEPDGRYLAMETIREFASQSSLPVLQVKNIGHGFINYPLPLGHVAKLTTGSQCILTFNFT